MYRTALVKAAVLVVALMAAGSVASGQQRFKTPEEAADALAAAARADDMRALLRILGVGSADIIQSGDPAADEERRKTFLAAYDAKHRIDAKDDKSATVLIGKDDWPFPIPLMQRNGAWQFNTAVGRTEVLYRRIGRNELAAALACLAYFDAQKEYAELDLARGGVGEYAQRIASNPRKKDGLYWPAAAGEPESPLGALVAAASQTGKVGSGEPFNGYYYKILTRQGSAASDGARNYLVRGRMIGGFALVAYPANYGISGVVTYLINQDGVLFEKDLGPSTGRIAWRMSEFNPDHTWRRMVEPQAEAATR